jgi:hypothetical protein
MACQIIARRKIAYDAFVVSRLVERVICGNGGLRPKKHQLTIGTMAQLCNHFLSRQQPSVRISAVGATLALSGGNLADTVNRESNPHRVLPVFPSRMAYVVNP